MKSKTKKYIEKLKKKKCKRCLAVFETQQELDEHRLYQHGEVSQDEHKKDRDSITHQIYSKYYGRTKPVKPDRRTPKVSEWITRLGGATYIWDCWEYTYYRYILGKGLYDGDLNLIAEDYNDYMKGLLEVVDEVQLNPKIKDVAHRIFKKPKRTKPKLTSMDVKAKQDVANVVNHFSNMEV